MFILSRISIHEKKIWDELIVNIIVGYYYLSKFIELITREDPTARSIEMIGLIINVIFIAVLTSIGFNAFIYFSSEKNTTLQNQQNKTFLLISNAVAFWSLVVGIFLIIGQLYISITFPYFFENKGIELTTIMVAHMLLTAIIVSFSIRLLVQAFLYRRGSSRLPNT